MDFEEALLVFNYQNSQALTASEQPDV